MERKLELGMSADFPTSIAYSSVSEPFLLKILLLAFEPILSLDLICALANFFPGLPSLDPPFSALARSPAAAVAEWFPFLFELQNFPFPFPPPPPPPLKINVTSSGTAGKRPWRGKMDGYVEGKRDVKKKLHSMRRRRDVLHRCCSRHLLPHFFSGNVVS